MITFLCHRCHTANEPCEGSSAPLCDRCREPVSHYITWKSPEEDKAAAVLIESELRLGIGGWGGSHRAKRALSSV